MTVLVSSRFAFQFDQPNAALLQFEAAALPEQEIVSCATRITDTDHFARVANTYAKLCIVEVDVLDQHQLIEGTNALPVKPRRREAFWPVWGCYHFKVA